MEADLLPNNNQNSLLIITIILGLFHLTFEIRQFIWDPAKYITDLWNYFDLGAYFLPIITSILWLHNNNPPSNWLISLSNLLLDLKFMLFLRVFHYFGVYFAIIPRQDFTVDQPTINDDPNNPWNLVNKYYTYFANNNSYSQDSYFVQQPDNTTNMFTRFPSSLLAMYNFLAGDNGAFGSWPLQDDPYLATLVFVFSFIVVIYLMNLFIGLLSNEIEKYDIQEAFLAQKAKIIAEIELFYLLPNQRRWRDWFPDILAYSVPVDDIVKKIKEIDDSNEDPDYLPFISNQLRSMVDRPRPDKHRLEQIENTMEIILKKLK
ncbi:6851_t:CDS:2 [Entrophospora sp. SA101]|nr:6851_t:CDS:2 [Entrophospora sp. SA101]